MTLIRSPKGGVFTAEGVVADYWLAQDGYSIETGSQDPRVTITKGGEVQSVHPETYPLWAVQGWSIDEDGDGIPDVLAGLPDLQTVTREEFDHLKSDRATVNLRDYGVLPTATAAVNAAGFAAAAAAGANSYFLPPGTYSVALTQGQALMGFTNRRVSVVGDNAVLNDLTAYSNNGPLTSMFLFDHCKDVEVRGIDYTGIALTTPNTLHGYQGGVFVRAVNGTDGVRVDARLSNLRYGVQTGSYADGAAGNCRNLEIRIRGAMVGYPVAAYNASGIRHDLDVDGVHRVAYMAGCDDVSGVARWRDQYIADTCYLITDAVMSGTDAGSNTVSKGCSNINAASIDKGSTVFQPSSVCAGITLSRVDPGTRFTNIKVRVSSTGTDTTSTTVGAFRVASGAKAVQTRYPFNWEPTVTLDGIEVSGVIDHSACTLPGNTGSEFYVLSYDTSTAHAAAVRNFNVQGLTILPSSAAAPRASYFHAPGLANPALFRGFNTPGLPFSLYTNAATETVLAGCSVADLNVSGVAGGSKVVIRDGTKMASLTCNVPVTNAVFTDLYGPGSPEGAVAAPKGMIYRRTDGGPAASLYVKDASGVNGADNTGWVLYGPPVAGSDPWALTTGQSSMPRGEVTTGFVATTSGIMRLAYFTGAASMQVGNIRLLSGSTAAGATPTLVRVGVYTVDGSGNLSLVGAIANDTGLLAAVSTSYTRQVLAPFAITPGAAYAVGVLVVTTAAAPTLPGMAISGPQSEYALPPRLCGFVSGLSDLPGSVAVASIGPSSGRPYVVLTL